MQNHKKYQHLVLFDGVCNFCNASIHFVIDHDPKKAFRFASLQSVIGQTILQKYHKNTINFDSIVLIKNDKILEKSDAALEITRSLSGLWPGLYIFKIVPKFIRNFMYDLVAKNRYQIFGKADACRLPTPEIKERFIE